MRYCVRCLYPENHPLYITFDKHGLCSGCQIHEEKDAIDWKDRLEHLKTIVNQYKSKSRTIHDCIIPVSGARDSFFIVHFVKHVLKLHPLLVTYNKQYNTHLGIRNLAYLRDQLGCDIMTMTVSPEKVKKITYETLRLRGSMYWHCIAGQTVFPVQIAAKFKIPLIIWGVHQGIDQVGMFSHLDEVEMTRKYRQEHDLMNLEAEDLLLSSRLLTEKDIEPYLYPNDKEIEAVGIRGIFLNNYIRWDSKAQHELMINMYNYETSQQARTFDTYNDVDCFHYSGLHDNIKFLKYGFGKVTDHACREIRLKRLTREQGIDLVARYNPVLSKDISLFLNWINMDANTFWPILDAFRDPRIWYQDENEKWQLKDSILNHRLDDKVEHYRLNKMEENHFINKKPKLNREDNKYVLFGRGWVD